MLTNSTCQSDQSISNAIGDQSIGGSGAAAAAMRRRCQIKERGTPLSLMPRPRVRAVRFVGVPFCAHCPPLNRTAPFQSLAFSYTEGKFSQSAQALNVGSGGRTDLFVFFTTPLLIGTAHNRTNDSHLTSFFPFQLSLVRPSFLPEM